MDKEVRNCKYWVVRFVSNLECFEFALLADRHSHDQWGCRKEVLLNTAIVVGEKSTRTLVVLVK